MNDIKDRGDIERLVRLFYERATKDQVIGHYFTAVVSIKWDEHIPTIVSFWGNILFQTGEYKGGMLFKHMNLHFLAQFKPVHFERWLSIWEDTVDELFSGEKAEEAKFRANSIAVIMQHKLRV